MEEKEEILHWNSLLETLLPPAPRLCRKGYKLKCFCVSVEPLDERAREGHDLRFPDLSMGEVFDCHRSLIPSLFLPDLPHGGLAEV